MRKYTRYFVVVVLSIFLSGCGISQSEYDKLKSENDSLKVELDDLKNGESRLVGIIDKSYLEKDYTTAKINILQLSSKHPESKKNAEYKRILAEIDKFEVAEKEKKDAAEKERIRLENLNNTGMWQNNYYVDNFGEKTKKKYITSTHTISGTFGNTATQDSELNVTFLINSASDISIQLYEYAGNNPVKAMSNDKYAVRVKDKDGKKYELSATNYSDRISLDSDDARLVHKALLKGGQIQFWIQEVETPTTQYQFSIENADWYDNAYQKLVSK